MRRLLIQAGRTLMHRRLSLCVAFMAVVAAEPALAQFDAPVTTNTRIRYIGALLTSPGEPTPEDGDQIGVFFGDEIIGRFTFSQNQEDPTAFAFFANGDDPFTEQAEGPAFGESVSFRFYDASTNFVRTDLAPVNSAGEIINVVFEGQVGIDIPIISLPPELLFPTADPPFDLLLGADPGDNGDNGNGGEPTPTGDPDVNGDGNVDREDAALVIRIVTGSGRGIDSATRGRADVNGDGRVTTADAIAVLRTSRQQ